MLLDIELGLEDPSCVASVPTPPAVKRPVELVVPLAMVLPVPMLELGVPIVMVLAVPVVGHVAPVKVVLVPEIGPGLIPGVASSVAPMGIPVDDTGDPAPMPSGDVIPSGDGPGNAPVPPTCAAAEP